MSMTKPDLAMLLYTFLARGYLWKSKSVSRCRMAGPMLLIAVARLRIVDRKMGRRAGVIDPSAPVVI